MQADASHEVGVDLRMRDAPPFWPPRVKARPAAGTAAWVLAHAGGGKIINFESEVGGLPRP